MKRIFLSFLLCFFMVPAIAADNVSSIKGEKTWLYKQPFQRPANFYKLKKSLDDKVCTETLGKLNESYSVPIEKDQLYPSMLVENSEIVEAWKSLTPEADRLQNLDQYIYHNTALDEPIYFYKFYSSLAGRVIEVISWSTNPLPEDVLVNDHWFNWVADNGKSVNVGYHKIDEVLKKFPQLPWSEKYIWGYHLGHNLMNSSATSKPLVVIYNDNPKLFCGNHYHVLIAALKDNTSEPICHYISIPTIRCEYH